MTRPSSNGSGHIARHRRLEGALSWWCRTPSLPRASAGKGSCFETAPPPSREPAHRRGARLLPRPSRPPKKSWLRTIAWERAHPPATIDASAFDYPAEDSALAAAPMISFANVSKQYGRQVLFVDASFQLNPGEKVGLVGPNGAGKTTMFRLITGEEDARRGRGLGARRS